MAVALFVNEGLRTISPELQLELSRSGGSAGNVFRSIIHKLGDKDQIILGPFNWTIWSGSLDVFEREVIGSGKNKRCKITLFGPHKKWSDLKALDMSKQESVDLILAALSVWPEIQGPEFIKRNLVDLEIAPELVDG